MKIIKWLDKHLEESILMILLGSIVVVMLYQIVRRYIFNSSLSWSEEFCRYCFIWFMFVANSFSIKLRSDLRVDAVLSALPGGVRKVVDFADLLISFLLTLFLFKCSFTTVAYVMSTGEKSVGLQLPMYVVYLSMPIGFGMSVVRYIQRAVFDIRALSGHGEEREEGAK